MANNSEQITVEVLVHAPLNKVWECWTSPAHIINWNFASDTWCCPAAINEIHPGGRLNWRMEAKDGSMGFDFEGTYDNIVDQSLIEYHIIDGRKVKIAFTMESGFIRVTESFDPESINSRELQQSGWQSILDNFKLYTEKIVISN